MSDAANVPKPWVLAAVCVGAALPLAVTLWGFTVDDALVTARVASRLAAGEGYRFNAGGQEVDAVTPLGFAHLLAAAGPATPFGMLERARWVGLAAWLVAAALLGCLLPRSRRALGAVVPVLALSAPLAGWASSGMETAIVTLAATLALFGGAAGAAAAGFAAAWRPELLPFAVVLVGGGALAAGEDLAGKGRKLALGLLLGLGPAVGVATVRNLWFGAAAPLAVLAKPSDLSHGLAYAAAGFLFTGAPLLLLAPASLRAAPGPTRVLALAVVAHFLAVLAAGGDWMALFRLLVPVLPAALLAGARLAELAPTRWLVARTVLAVAASVALLAWRGLPARTVLEHRRALIARAEPLLRNAQSVAALDIGWVGAATNARILDLAGITDPLVARLPGGHTTKRISEGLIENRDVDTAILLLAPEHPVATPWNDSVFARQVENRLAQLAPIAEFRVVERLPLGGTRQSYVIVSRPIGRR